jgi:ketosteroid isomerase-like protein
MSAAANKKLMENIFARIREGDRSLFVASLADDVTMTVTGQYSWSQTFRGRETVLRDLFGYVRSLLEEGSRTLPFRFIADDDWVVVEARGDLITKAGERYDNHYCLIYRIEDGKIREIREYEDSTLCERVLGPFPAARKQAAGCGTEIEIARRSR